MARERDIRVSITLYVADAPEHTFAILQMEETVVAVPRVGEVMIIEEHMTYRVIAVEHNLMDRRQHHIIVSVAGDPSPAPAELVESLTRHGWHRVDVPEDPQRDGNSL